MCKQTIYIHICVGGSVMSDSLCIKKMTVDTKQIAKSNHLIIISLPISYLSTHPSSINLCGFAGAAVTNYTDKWLKQ